MKFTLSWLKTYLDTDASAAEISRVLTAIGLEVESVSDPAKDLEGFVVAEILEAEPHPDADRLQVCKVNDGSGDEPLQIVCGAPNARAGIKVVLAQVGVVIPHGGFTIKASKIRGVASQGMLCSAAELGLGEDSDGIMELSATAQVGRTFVSEAGLDDPLFDIAITPNRGDCLGVFGIARDLAAAGLGHLRELTVPKIDFKGPSSISVAIEDSAHCPLFVGCVISGVNNGPSPEWLQQRLRAIGVNPISALVDITNYIAFEFGRPLHVYDAGTLGKQVTIRAAQNGEVFEALNDQSYTLSEGMTVVADADSVLALGGVIGGVSSGCSDDTQDVFLEVALFDAVQVARAGRQLQIITDSRYRFERHVDPLFVLPAAAIAIAMIQELCGGEASDLVVGGDVPETKRVIEFPLSEVSQRGGVSVEEKETIRILSALGFVVEGSGAVRSVTVPSWRSDVEGSADLVEEVLRIFGYDAIEPVSLVRHVSADSVFTVPQKRMSSARRLLASRGLVETVTWSFMSSTVVQLFGEAQPSLTLLNPISSDLDVMRPSIIPNLVQALQRNADRGIRHFGLFEVGPVFYDPTATGTEHVISGVRTGKIVDRNVYHDDRDVDSFDAKGDVFALLESFRLPVDNLIVTRDVPAWYHPGRSGALQLGKHILGYFGELHPLILEQLDVEDVVVGFELFVERLPVPKAKKSTARPVLCVSDYQPVERDFAFVLDEGVAAYDVVKLVRGVEKQLIRSVSLFDVYQGKGIEEGKKSVAFSVILQAMDRTLTDDDIEHVSQKVVDAVTGRLGAVLRG